MEQRKPRVLIVDDVADNIRMLSETLSANYRVVAATNGASALRIAGSEDPPELILLDIVMPEMDGFAVCERLKKDDRTRPIPVVFITVVDQIEQKTRGFDLGAVDYITKPFDMREVEARVRTHIALVEAMKTVERQNRELVEAAKLKEDVEQITRHDLKGPLTAIIGIPQLMLLEEDLSSKQREDLETIQESGRKLLRMINLSLDLLKMERGLYTLLPKEVDLVKVLRDVRQGLLPLAGAFSVEIRILVDGRAATQGEGKTILGEELLCYSLFANLLKNAVEASPADESVLVDVRGDTSVQTRVTNKGEVPAAIRSSFFGKLVTHGKQGGTGLGAYSARLMTTTLGGSISLDSAREGYTSITVTLPGLA